jgi:hypothetical protein
VAEMETQVVEKQIAEVVKLLKITTDLNRIETATGLDVDMIKMLDILIEEVGLDKAIKTTIKVLCE